MPPPLGAEYGVDLTIKESFGHWITDTLRFADLDILGHVTHPAYVYLFQNGRASFWRENAELPSIVAARITVDYRASLLYPGSVRTGQRLLRIGNASITMGQGMFNDAGECASVCLAHSVHIDKATGRSSPWPDDWRRRLESLLGKGGGNG